VLLGYVLLRHTAPSTTTQKPTWDSLDLGALLGPQYEHLTFATMGPLNQSLTVAGESIAYGKVELLDQDGSILGWTCGNAVASGRDIAKFYYDLLSESGSLLSKESLAVMQNWSRVDVGWASNALDYGAGLMIQNVSPKVKAPPSVSDFSTYIGHGGDTYAFMSDNGFFPGINASISVIVNIDYDFEYPTNVITCPVFQLAAKYAGFDVDLGCEAPVSRDDMHYECQSLYGHPTCVGGIRINSNMTRVECNATCR